MEISAQDAKIRRMLAGQENVVCDELHSVIKILEGNTKKKLQFFDKALDADFRTDCDLTEDRKLPQGEDFLIQSIMLRGSNTMTDAEYNRVFDRAVLVFKPQAAGGIERRYTIRSLGAGGGKAGFTHQAIAADQAGLTNGVPQKNSELVLQVPELLEAQQQFDAYIAWGAPPTADTEHILELELVFRGLHAFNVEAISK